MDGSGVREIPTAYVNRPSRMSGMSGAGRARHDQVKALLELAEQLQSILVPVEPNADFRRRLHGDLVLEGQRRRLTSGRDAEPAAPNLFLQHRRGILIGAAAVGSLASVVGVIIAFVMRHRHGGPTRMAAG